MTERRRGLGRGLGALIPTRALDLAEPPYPSAAYASDAGTGTPTDTGTGTGTGTGTDTARDAAQGVDGVSIESDLQSDAAGDQTWVTRRGASDSAAADGSHPDAVAGLAHYAEIPVHAIRTNPRQPRQVFDDDALAELTHSIREVGVLQPIVVRELDGTPLAPANEAGAAESTYELVMGERRWRAAQAAGLATVPAIVRETKDDALLRDALLENLHRAQLNPLEEAAAYDQLLADFGCTQDELAQRIGRSRPQISNTIRLLRLSPEVQRRVAAGVLTAGHARALLGLDDAASQDRLAQRIVAEGLSVRSVEELVAMGDLGPAERAPRRAHAPVAPALSDLSARLSEHFETRVKVDLGRRKGKITIEFASVADLERIVSVIAPSADARADDAGGQ